MTIYSRNAQLIGENRTNDKGIFNLFDAHQLKGLNKWGTLPEAYVVTALNESSITLSGGIYRVFVGGAGGGGASQSGERGGLGGIIWFEVALEPGTYYAGVGAGGKYTSTSSTNLYRNTAGYVCRGGSGTYGDNGGSGSGGGGSYFRGDAIPSTAHWNKYYSIVGGGGGAATHGFDANNGGHGFGVGGGAYSTAYPNTTNGGKNGFDGSGGAGGDAVTNTGLDGGDADNANQLIGGTPPYRSSDKNGGAGGGGAGGGGAGANGGTTSTTADHGGYVSTSTTVGSYSAEVIPRGGGGGGGHSNDCAGTGGGGGILVFTDYNNSWGETQGTDIPHWANSNITTSTVDQYTAWGDLSTYSSTYFGADLTASGGALNGKCTHGLLTTAGGDGFVVIASLDTVISSVTYVT